MFTGSHYVMEIRPPQLISEVSDTKKVNASGDFELVCESDKPIFWSYPQLTFSPEEVKCELLI